MHTSVLISITRWNPRATRMKGRRLEQRRLLTNLAATLWRTQLIAQLSGMALDRLHRSIMLRIAHWWAEQRGHLSVGSLLSFVSVGQGLSAGKRSLCLRVAHPSSWESQSSHLVVWSFSQIRRRREQQQMDRVSLRWTRRSWGAREVGGMPCGLLMWLFLIGSCPVRRWEMAWVRQGKKYLLRVLLTRF